MQLMIFVLLCLVLLTLHHWKLKQEHAACLPPVNRGHLSVYWMNAFSSVLQIRSKSQKQKQNQTKQIKLEF